MEALTTGEVVVEPPPLERVGWSFQCFPTVPCLGEGLPSPPPLAGAYSDEAGARPARARRGPRLSAPAPGTRGRGGQRRSGGRVRLPRGAAEPGASVRQARKAHRARITAGDLLPC